jgi:hypothetical protein
MMGAGLGSASLYKSNPNVNTFGGDKKQGLPISVGLDPWADRATRILSIGTNRNKLFVMNQLGGVGVGRSMFNVYYTNKDGVKKYVSNPDNVINFSLDLIPGVELIPGESIQNILDFYSYYYYHINNDGIFMYFKNIVITDMNKNYITFDNITKYTVNIINNKCIRFSPEIFTTMINDLYEEFDITSLLIYMYNTNLYVVR